GAGKNYQSQKTCRGDAGPKSKRSQIGVALVLNLARHEPNRQNSQHTTEGRTNARRPLADAKTTERQYHHPIQQGGLFEPGVTSESRSYKVIPEKHLTRHLRVTRLIRPNEGDGAEPEKVEG